MSAIEAIAQPVSVAAKQPLFLEDDEMDAAYTVTAGAAKLYRHFRDGRRQIVSFLLPGDFVGLEPGGRHEYSADAITDVTLCRFPRNDFTALIGNKPHLMSKLHETCACDLHEARDHMLALGQRSAGEKIAWFLIHLRNRQAETEFPSGIVGLPMPRQDIADFLGLTIETVSRTLTKFARDGSIEILPGGVRIADRGKIERLAAA